jgi:hypothetical protein
MGQVGDALKILIESREAFKNTFETLAQSIIESTDSK